MSVNKCVLLYAVVHNNELWFYSGGNSTYIDLGLIIHPFIQLPLKLWVTSPFFFFFGTLDSKTVKF